MGSAELHSGFNTCPHTSKHPGRVSGLSADQIVHLPLHFVRFEVSAPRKNVKISQWLHIRVSTSSGLQRHRMGVSAVTWRQRDGRERERERWLVLSEEARKHLLLLLLFCLDIRACLVYEAVTHVLLLDIRSIYFICGWDLSYSAKRRTVLKFWR